ncbi:homologous recombination OB-fold protein [Triplophysa dalaica]|uniref:homologous recombination OB-fold protein n=1 Tax=Triplophysa dalaica TaxID=1582913 RepID=UPI0024E00E4A|nr:homologous recombination OB-fold protein [Triplophysa dalaica]
MINRTDMTAAACNQWTGLFSVGEQFDDEDLLEADWSCVSESTSASAFIKDANPSSDPGGGTSASLCAPTRGPVKTSSDLSIPGHRSVSSSVSSLRAPASSLQPSSSFQTNPPPPSSLSVPQRDLPAPDDFDDWDVDLDELDECVPQIVSQPQKNSASDLPLDSISPAKRMRPSASSGAAPAVSSRSFSSPVSEMPRPLINPSSSAQGPTYMSYPTTPMQNPRLMRGPATTVSQFPRPVTPKPSVVSPQGWGGPSAPRTPLQPRGSLFHSVSNPDPSPTLTPRQLNTPVLTNHLVQLVSAANKTPQRPQSRVTRAQMRRFPGPAGALPQQVSEQSLDDIVVSVPHTPAHGAVARLRSEVSSSQGSEEDEFSRGPWAVMKTEMGLDERNPSCFLHSYSVVMVLRKAALKQLAKNKVPNMAVVLKSITHTHADAKAVFRDPTGEMQGTVHRRLVEERQGELKTGAVLLLKQVGVFSPSHRNHYLNVTPNNLLRIYPPDGVLHNSQISQPSLELASCCEPAKPAGGPVSQMELHFDYDDDDDDEGEKAVELKRADAGVDHTQKAQKGSGRTEDTPWDTDDLDELLGQLPVESYGGEL